MNDAELQEEELCVLESIYGDDCARLGDRCFEVCVPARHAPHRLLLRVLLPDAYPSCSAPALELHAPHLSDDVTHWALQQMEAMFAPGEVVLYNAIEWLKEQPHLWQIGRAAGGADGGTSSSGHLPHPHPHGHGSSRRQRRRQQQAASRALLGHMRDMQLEGAEGLGGPGHGGRAGGSVEYDEDDSDYEPDDDDDESGSGADDYDWDDDEEGGAAAVPENAAARAGLQRAPCTYAVDDAEVSAAMVELAPLLVSGEPVTERKSTFQAHACPVKSYAEVKAVVALLLQSNKIRAATHNIMAYRIHLPGRNTFLQDFDDDGETAAGGRLLHLLQVADVRGVVVVVSRWFGGVLLGPSRFTHINNCARAHLVALGYIKPAPAAGAVGGAGGHAGGGSSRRRKKR